MFRIWSEREMPAGPASMVEGVAEVIGPGGDAPDDLLAAISGADAVIVSAHTVIDAAVMDRVPGLKVIARTGIGYDNIDVEAATERGIVVCTTPDAPTRSTAEHTVALMLAVAKRIPQAQAALRTGGRDFFAAHRGVELAGRTLGLVGAGRIGRTVAGVASGLGMEVLAYDPIADPGALRAAGIASAHTLGELIEDADVVSLHAPLTGDTRRMIGGPVIERMKPEAILVNTARGGLIDHDALVGALEDGAFSGVGLDTTDPEPLPPDHPLLHIDRVIVTPHVAAATGAGKTRLYEDAVTEVLAVLLGRSPAHPVEPNHRPSKRPDPNPHGRTP